MYFARCIFAVITGTALLLVSAHAESPSASRDWVALGNKILHQIAGDDLKAYWNITPKLEIVSDARPNAFAYTPDRVIISSGLLNLINDDAEFAFILLHEIAHLKELNQPKQAKLGGFKGKYLIQELEADKFSACQMHGHFAQVAGAIIIDKIMQQGSKATTDFTSIYPSLGVRKNALLKQINDSSGTTSGCDYYH